MINFISSRQEQAVYTVHDVGYCLKDALTTLFGVVTTPLAPLNIDGGCGCDFNYRANLTANSTYILQRLFRRFMLILNPESEGLTVYKFNEKINIVPKLKNVFWQSDGVISSYLLKPILEKAESFSFERVYKDEKKQSVYDSIIMYSRANKSSTQEWINERLEVCGLTNPEDFEVNSWSKQRLFTRGLYALAIPVAVITKIADLGLAVFGAAVSVCTVGKYRDANYFTMSQLSSLNLIHRISFSARAFVEPTLQSWSSS